MTFAAVARACLVLCLAAQAGCSGIDFHDNPSKSVGKQTGPLTVPPADLKNGATP